MKNRAVCYACDAGFLFPTVVSAISVRRQGLQDAHLVIAVVDGDRAMLDELRTTLTQYNISFEVMPRAWEGKFDAGQFVDSYVPHSSLARVFLPDLLPDSIDELLYLDGDTLAVRDLTPLLGAQMPSGRIGAVEDMYSFLRDNPGSYGTLVRSYFEGIGIRQGYFNSGVLRGSRRTIQQVWNDAFAFFCSRPSACLHYDQSATCAVAQDRRVSLPLRFNLTPSFLERMPVRHSPHLMHFAGPVKPWVAEIWPMRKYHAPYRDMAPFAMKHGLPVATITDEEATKLSSSAIRRTIRHCTKTLPLTAMTGWKILQYERSAMRIG